MRKPQFGLVIGLLATFFVLALIRVSFEKYIPQLPPNKLANLPGAFLRAAVHQPVDWQPTPSEAFARAATLGRPVLFVVGSPSSRVGALMDSRVFSIWSVATEINNAFVPVRIDLDEHPEWEAAAFPLSRLKTPFCNDFQVFSADSKGRIERLFDPPQDASQIDPAAFIDLLTASRRDFDEDLTSKNVPIVTQVQRQDLQELGAGGQRQLPGFEQFANALNDSISSSTGAFVENGFIRMLPEAWLYLSRVNRKPTMTKSLNRFLLSPSMDVLRGGFFGVSESGEGLSINFAEKTADNAAMASALAESGVTMHETFYTIAAQRTFDMILRDLSDGNFLVAYRPSDEDLISGKSATSSFSAGALSQELFPLQVSWANENLSPGQNRQQVLFLANQGAIIAPDLDRICHRLRQINPSPQVTGQEFYLDVNGNALANLCRCARIWGDADRLRQVRNYVSSLDAFTSGLEISHTREPAEASPVLSDYLAYADVQLQFYLATGENSHFVEGREVLIRAMKTFTLSSDRLASFFSEDRSTIPADFNNPQVVDPGTESTTAQAIRLCLAYGRMMGPTRQGKFLVKIASDQVSKYSSLSVGTSPSLAGYYLASADLGDPLCAFAVGPKAVEESNALFELRPSRLVSPATRYVRPDLNSRAPGIYIVSGSLVSGPFSVEKAAELIPTFDQVGVIPEV